MLKNKILKKEKLIGSYVQLADPNISTITGLAGYDLIWVDYEHSYMSFETLLSHLTALKATGTPSIVRVPQDDLTSTKKILEMGPDGIIFPMVTSAGETERLIATTLYPPYGNRGFGPMGAIDYGHKDAFEYVRSNHKDLCRFIQIEHKDAIADLDKIMDNPYIDGYIFGPNDLAGSYNMLGDAYCDFIAEVIEDAIKRLRARGKYVAIAAGGMTKEVVAHWAGFDIDMLFAGADFDFIRDGAIRTRTLLEEELKNK